MLNPKAVIGLGFGDEGKGLVTSYLCSQVVNPLVARFSGGHQAGHTVVNDGVRHIFSNFGSGTLQGVPTYWSEYCTFEPVGFIREIHTLNQKMDIDSVKIYINRFAPITTPYDILANQIHEDKHSHGSVGVGFGKTIERHEKSKIVVADIFHEDVMRQKLETAREYHGLEKVDEDYFLWSIQNVVSGVEDGAIEIVDDLPRNLPQGNAFVVPNYIFEGSQGLLLDQDYGFFPHVTRSNVGSKRVNLFHHTYDRWYVTRAYQTRHGNGPMTNEKYADDLVLKNNEEETNVLNKYQGPLKITPLDIELLWYALQRDREETVITGEEYLVITCMDQMENFVYSFDGELHTADSENEFVAVIAEKLGFSKEQVYLSYSPDNTLKKW